MTIKYKDRERAIKKIVMDNASPVEEGKRIQIITYYRNFKIVSLLKGNHPKPMEDPLKLHITVY